MKLTDYTVRTELTSVSRWLSMIEAFLDVTKACILAESPRRVIFRMLSKGLSEDEVMEATSCIVFDADAEMRIEKISGTLQRQARLICEHKGNRVIARESQYFLRYAPEGNTMLHKLVYLEYFSETESGMLVPCCARLSGVIS